MRAGHGQNGLGFMEKILQEGFALGTAGFCVLRVTNPSMPAQPVGALGLLFQGLWWDREELKGMKLQKINP